MRTTSLLTTVAPSVIDVPTTDSGGDVVAERTASWHHSASLVYSRRTHRIPFSASLSIRGLNERFEPIDDELKGTARDISGDGISFRHETPLPYRFVALTYQTARGEVSRRARLTWCRYLAEGFYVSGGRFLHQT